MNWKSRLLLLILAGFVNPTPTYSQAADQPSGPTAAKPADGTSVARGVRKRHRIRHIAYRPRAHAAPPVDLADNAVEIGVMSEGANSHYMRMTADLAATFTKPQDLRVLGIIGKGTVQNIHDLASLKGVDVAIMHSDAIDIAKKLGDIPNLNERITYIARLQNEEMHVLARNEITDIHQLDGKRVNVAAAGGGIAASSQNVLEHLGVKAQLVNLPQSAALEKLKAGEIDAVIDWDPYPDSTFANFKGEGNFHFLPVPYEKDLQDVYFPASIPADTYPGLVPAGQKLDTVSLNAVIAAYNWPKDSERYRLVARFTKELFERFAELQSPAREDVWKSINPVGVAQGWKRFPAAQEWVDANNAHPTEPQTGPDVAEFKAFLKEQGKAPGNNQADAEKLFEQFVEWRKSKSAAPQLR